MGEFPRKSDGRRVFTVEFKRGVVQQLLKGEKTLAEVSRECPAARRTRGHGPSGGPRTIGAPMPRGNQLTRQWQN